MVTRVTEAAVRVDGEVVGSIAEPGLLVLVAATHSDTSEQAGTMARKLHELRALREERSCATADAPLLVISQFTLYGSTRKGRRPSWGDAAAPAQAEPLVETLVERLRERGARVETGVFGAEMAVQSTNDGPFTLLVET